MQARFGADVAHMVSKVSKLSQMNQLLRRGKRKVNRATSQWYFKCTREILWILGIQAWVLQDAALEIVERPETQTHRHAVMHTFP